LHALNPFPFSGADALKLELKSSDLLGLSLMPMHGEVRQSKTTFQLA
jgi:hypothetical protein